MYGLLKELTNNREMKASELRIGNWVAQEKKYYQLDENSLIDILDYWKVYKEVLYQPIPLTEEWLLKFGFKKDSIFGVDIKYKIGYFEVWYFRNTDSYMLENIKNMKVFIKYVHQLQNLYFALCNEELVIK